MFLLEAQQVLVEYSKKIRKQEQLIWLCTVFKNMTEV